MKRQRQALIKKKIQSGMVSSQRQLVKMLRDEGFNVSQTTVSRDLRQIGLVKGRDHTGKARYGDPERLRGGARLEDALRRMAPDFLLTAEPTGNMVVIKTSVGGAQGLAAAIDQARMNGVVGTVAGDDTILVVCSEGVDSGKITENLLGYGIGKR